MNLPLCIFGANSHAFCRNFLLKASSNHPTLPLTLTILSNATVRHHEMITDDSIRLDIRRLNQLKSFERRCSRSGMIVCVFRWRVSLHFSPVNSSPYLSLVSEKRKKGKFGVQVGTQYLDVEGRGL